MDRKFCFEIIVFSVLIRMYGALENVAFENYFLLTDTYYERKSFWTMWEKLNKSVVAKKAAFKTRRACFLLHFYYFHVIIPLFSDDDFRQPTMVHQKCFCLFGFGHLFGLHCVFYGNKIFRRSTWTSIDSLRKGKKLKKKLKS